MIYASFALRVDTMLRSITDSGVRDNGDIRTVLQTFIPQAPPSALHSVVPQSEGVKNRC
jgi:hypothetical protein